MEHVVWALVAALTFVCTIARGDGPTFLYDGYRDAAPEYPRGQLYSRFYYNLPSVLFCATTGDVFKNATNGGWTSTSAYRGVVGCQPPSTPTFYNLFPLEPATAAEMRRECDSADESAWKAMRRAVPSNQDELNLVLLPSLRDAGLSNATQYSLRCVLRQIAAHNAQGGRVAAFTAFRSLTDTNGMAASSPLHDVSPYSATTQHAWNPSGSGALWAGRNLTGLFFNVSLDAPEARRIQLESYYNLQRYRGNPDVTASPRFVSETNMAMRQLKYALPLARDTCLTLQVPSCLPIGGMSVWATTQQGIPSWQNRDSPNAPQKLLTAQGSIAIMVASTTTALFHDVVPGANAAASGSVALMAIINAIATSFLAALRYNAAAPQLYFFFFAAEEYGLAGSGRFVKEVVSFRCENYPTENATDYGCMYPNYKYLNFTSIDLDAFDHFIAIDQVAVGSDLFYHMDETVYGASAAQQRVSSLLQALGIQRSSVAQLPPTSLFTFLKHFNASSRAQKSFTAISGYNTQFVDAAYQSSSDLPSNGSPALVLRSAQVVLELVVRLLNDHLSPPQQLTVPRVDQAFGLVLWDCMAVNTQCEYFNKTFSFRPPFAEPNYYTSVFAFYQNIGLQQQFLFYYAADQLKDTTGPYNATVCPCASWYEICIWGKCYPKQSFLHHSFSPALEYVNKAPIYFNQSDSSLGQGYQIWVESFWEQSIGARLAATDSTHQSNLILMCGILVTAAVAGSLVLLKRVVAPKLKEM